MMKTRPRALGRLGLLSAAALLGAVACADSAATPTPVPPTPTVVPTVAPSVAASVAPTLAPSSVPSVTATVVPSVAPSAVVPASVVPSAAPTDPGTAAATERPGPTPIVGEIKPAPELVDLVKPDGTPFLLSDLADQTTLLFFGYTHCPDVCPATLGELIGVLQARPDVRVVFITVDPERDTPDFLAEWTKYLPEGLVSVTGSPLAIRHAADSYGAKYARVDTESAAGYSMSHTAFQYLIDGEGNLVLTYPFGTLAAAIIGDLDQLERAG